MWILKNSPVWAADGTEAGASNPAAAETSPPTPDVSAASPPPSPEPVVESSSTSSDSDFILDAFDAMQVEDLDDGSAAQAAVAEPPQAPEATQTGVTPPVQTQQAPVAPGPTPPVTAPAAPAAAPQPGAASPPVTAGPGEAPEMILQRMHEEVAKHSEVFQQKLAETVYKLPEKELEKFNEDPSGVIAKVAARVHTNVVSSMTRVLAQQMPVYVHGLLQANERAQRNENEFWQSNPFLNKAQHEPVVTQIAVMYKQMNPQASREQFIKTVGAMAMGALGITAQAVAQRANGQPPPPPVQTPGRVVRQVPAAYAPAGAHAAPPGSHPAPPQNQWERMTMLIDQSDQGGFDT